MKDIYSVHAEQSIGNGLLFLELFDFFYCFLCLEMISAFFEGTDWIIRKIPSVFEQSVKYFLLSKDNNLSCRQNVDNSILLDSYSLFFNLYH